MVRQEKKKYIYSFDWDVIHIKHGTITKQTKRSVALLESCTENEIAHESKSAHVLKHCKCININ